MSVVAHIMDVGCGNMVLLQFPDGSVFCYDCNITEDNKLRILGYANKVLGQLTPIDVFINSHRDADHMRGIKSLHKSHPIRRIWDTGVPGTTTDSSEYEAYMDLRRTVGYTIVEARKYWMRGAAKLRFMNAAWDGYLDPNEQSIVLKIEYKNGSLMLAGDTNFRPWKEKLLTHYGEYDFRSSILLAAHHGSITFFDDPSDTQNYYVEHIRKIAPAMTLISVGPNPHGLPDAQAVGLYRKYSSGSNQGNKVHTTSAKGTMKLTLQDNDWSLSTNQ